MKTLGIRRVLKGIWRKPPASVRDLAVEPVTATASDQADTRSEESTRLLEISRAAVALADLGPRLVSMAVELQGLAHSQAHQTVAISGTTARLTDHLKVAVASLRETSLQVEKSLSTVGRISENTKIISINASIEAARAGVHGRAFGVVVGEIQRLSEESGGVTHEIEARVNDMQGSIVRVEAVAGVEQSGEREGDSVSVTTVNRGVQSLADAAGRQLNEAKALSEIGAKMNGLADNLLRSIGAFRFELHTQAETALVSLVEALSGASSRPEREAVMAEWLSVNSAFELVYSTDASGRQDVDNLIRAQNGVVHDQAGYGKDWSKRPWYVDALAATGVVCSDLYQSAATGDYCFTVSMRTTNPGGDSTGVVAADVNFRRLLEL